MKLGALNDGWESFIEETVNDLTPVIANADTVEESGIFDHLIVDETQNLCDQVFLKLMDVLLKKGLANGKWTMFGDFAYQQIITTLDHNDTDGEDVLKKIRTGLEIFREDSDWWSCVKLETNCRNTQQISEAVKNLVRIETLPRSGVGGPAVEIKLFDSLDGLNEILKDLISTYRKEGYKSTECILLSSSRSGNDNDDVFNNIVNNYNNCYDGWKLHSLSESIEGSSSQSDILRYSDVYDYQGLESNFVILVMPRTGEEVELAGGIVLTQVAHLDRVLYTGMSRAHTCSLSLPMKITRQFYGEDGTTTIGKLLVH